MLATKRKTLTGVIKIKNNDLGIYLKHRRSELDLSIKSACSLTVISRSYLNRLENHCATLTYKKPSTPNKLLKRISLKYDVDFNYLCTLAGINVSEHFIPAPTYISYPYTINNSYYCDVGILLNSFIDILDSYDNRYIYGASISDDDWEYLKKIFRNYVSEIFASSLNVS